MKNLRLLSIIATTLFISCSSDDDEVVETTEVIEVTAPAAYTFNRDSESTVAFSGQTTRILMAEATVTAFKDWDTATEASILAMFAHVEEANDFDDADLNASNKSVRSKVAASRDYFGSNATEAAAIKNTFDSYIAVQMNEIAPQRDALAEPGVAGQIADESSTRYVAGNGLEYNQVFAKGLIGSLMMDQMLNNYLSTSVLDEATNVADNDAGIKVEGKPYTTMEHKWDEGYGYLFGGAENPENPVAAIGEGDNFLNKYLGRVEGDADFTGITQTIFDAFKLGRAAIVAKNYDVRNEQAAIIRLKVSEAIAIRAIYYLQNGKFAIENNNLGTAFHDLSEGYGLVTSLRYTRNSQDDASYFTPSEVTSFVDDLLTDGPNGLWDLTPATLDAISESIASRFNFTVSQAASTN
ncbi:DUF4856 domain-containing protein [Patiriisocius sp. Uisw_047]|jgi:hypothetical protein|uniref:DUF4856 domain-containing protein n=1 Tax=Patiriisocius sp. Uisw_047 TaxID=3230969 RepID=UPI0039EB5BF2